MHLVRITTLLTILTTTFALPHNPVVNAINGFEKKVNSIFDTVTRSGTDYFTSDATPDSGLSGLTVSDAYGINILAFGVVGLYADLLLRFGLPITIALPEAWILGIGVMGIAVFLQRDHINPGGKASRIINEAKAQGVSVQIVPKSRQEAFLRDLALKVTANPQTDQKKLFSRDVAPGKADSPSTSAATKNPVVNAINGLEKKANAVFEGATKAGTDYFSSVADPKLGMTMSELHGIASLAPAVAGLYADFLFTAGLPMIIAIPEAWILGVGVTGIAIFLQRDHISRDGETSRIIKTAKEQGVSVQIVPKSQQVAFLQDWISKQKAGRPHTNRKKLFSRNVVPVKADIPSTASASSQNPFVNIIDGLVDHINSVFDAVTHAGAARYSPEVAVPALGLIQSEFDGNMFLTALASSGTMAVEFIAGLSEWSLFAAPGAFLLGLGVMGIAVLLQGDHMPHGGDVSRIINKAKAQGVGVQVVFKSQREAFLQDLALKQAARPQRALRSGQKAQ
ncbi:MAG: hypothetical protein M1816_004323 [Peltula sp. TS41687]|nr:MAG: hypothetical protein M1816_004323 [Peltula sp. TS41687]